MEKEAKLPWKNKKGNEGMNVLSGMQKLYKQRQNRNNFGGNFFQKIFKRRIKSFKKIPKIQESSNESDFEIRY